MNPTYVVVWSVIASMSDIEKSRTFYNFEDACRFALNKRDGRVFSLVECPFVAGFKEATDE